jgi:hypothetical protein
LAYLALGGCGSDESAEPDATAEGATSLALMEENGSGVTGSVALSPGDGEFAVTLAVKGPDRYHAHIHDVSCADYRAIKDFNAQFDTVVETLKDVHHGESQTDVAAPLSDFTNGKSSVNVHRFESPYPVVACGDIPAA